MKMPTPAALLALLTLSGCAPEVIDLAMFDVDAGGAAALDAGAAVEDELDAGPPPAAFDAASDAGRANTDLDARARGDADRAGGSCASKDDCAPGQLCDLVGCGTNMKGTCVHAEECSNERFDPVCDCNGFKYLSDCVRRQHGVPRDRECAVQRPPCTGKGTCPATPEGVPTHCGFPAQRLMNYQCSRGERACYVVPECPGIFGPTSPTARLYSACDPSRSGAAITMGAFEICTTACDAIKSGDQFAPAAFTTCLVAPPRMGGGQGGPGGSGFSTF